jgi:alkylhydroperoxidase/carboxymuconolactone decarboxylase family protein YurZ
VKDAPIWPQLRATFRDTMDGGTIAASSFTLTDEVGQPAHALTYGKTYTVRLASTIRTTAIDPEMTPCHLFAPPNGVRDLLITPCPRRKPMSDPSTSISNAFQVFMADAPKHAQAWGGMVQALASASALDGKTTALAYLAVLAALRLESGVPFHVQQAKQRGASRDEVISAILVGLPAAGHGVTQVLPAALAAYDAS